MERFVMGIFFILMVIAQIAGMIYSGKERKKGHAGLAKKTLLFFFALSSAFSVIFSAIAIANEKYMLGDIVFWYFSLCVVSFVLQFILFLIGQLVFRKDKKGEPEEFGKLWGDRKKKHIIWGVIASFCFVAAIAGEYLLFQHNRHQIYYPTKKEEEKAINMVNQYLLETYGDGNFRVTEIKLGIPAGFQFDAKYQGFYMMYATDYMEEEFKVSVDIFTEEIQDNFLAVYYHDSMAAGSNLEAYLCECVKAKIIPKIPEEFEAKLQVLDRSFRLPEGSKFGKVPTVEELCEYVVLGSPKLVIEKDLRTEEELLQYLINFFVWFEKNVDSSRLYRQEEDKYFSYQYDLTRIGMENSDSYYSGYVAAGDYVRSEDGESYVFTDADKVVRFCVASRVYVYTLEGLGVK